MNGRYLLRRLAVLVLFLFAILLSFHLTYPLIIRTYVSPTSTTTAGRDTRLPLRLEVCLWDWVRIFYDNKTWIVAYGKLEVWKDPSRGVPVVGRTVHVKVDGVTYEFTTEKTGEYSGYLKQGFVADVRSLEAWFDGDSSYKPVHTGPPTEDQYGPVGQAVGYSEGADIAHETTY